MVLRHPQCLLWKRFYKLNVVNVLQMSCTIFHGVHVGVSTASPFYLYCNINGAYDIYRDGLHDGFTKRFIQWQNASWWLNSFEANFVSSNLTHWGRMRNIWVGKLTGIGSNNGLSPDGILLIGPLRTNFCGILIEIGTFSLKKTHSTTSSGKWPTFCLGLNVLSSYS